MDAVDAQPPRVFVCACGGSGRDLTYNDKPIGNTIEKAVERLKSVTSPCRVRLDERVFPIYEQTPGVNRDAGSAALSATHGEIGGGGNGAATWGIRNDGTDSAHLGAGVQAARPIRHASNAMRETRFGDRQPAAHRPRLPDQQQHRLSVQTSTRPRASTSWQRPGSDPRAGNAVQTTPANSPVSRKHKGVAQHAPDSAHGGTNHMAAETNRGPNANGAIAPLFQRRLKLARRGGESTEPHGHPASHTGAEQLIGTVLQLPPTTAQGGAEHGRVALGTKADQQPRQQHRQRAHVPETATIGNLQDTRSGRSRGITRQQRPGSVYLGFGDDATADANTATGGGETGPHAQQPHLSHAPETATNPQDARGGRGRGIERQRPGSLYRGFGVDATEDTNTAADSGEPTATGEATSSLPDLPSPTGPASKAVARASRSSFTLSSATTPLAGSGSVHDSAAGSRRVGALSPVRRTFSGGPVDVTPGLNSATSYGSEANFTFVIEAVVSGQRAGSGSPVQRQHSGSTNL